jgi:hypothetical protein
MTKFKVGQVWADRDGRKSQVVRTASSYKFPRLVDKVYPVTVVDLKMGTEFHVTEKGHFYGLGGESSADLITLIKDKEETVSDKSDKVPVRNAVTNLPPEPVAGAMYSTGNGLKMKFITETQRYFLYEEQNTMEIHKYGHAFKYHSTCLPEYDIIAPWTEPLPEVEIKRWAVVRTTPYKGLCRGYVRAVGDNKKTLELDKQDDEEIVELVGTLPSKEI